MINELSIEMGRIENICELGGEFEKRIKFISIFPLLITTNIIIIKYF